LATALREPIAQDGAHHGLSRDICPEILELLSGGDFEQLASKLFAFANAIPSTGIRARRQGMVQGDSELRAELSRLTNPPNDVVGEASVAAWLHLQIQKISELITKYSHGVSVEVPWSKEITGLNCYMHALGLSPDAISNWRWPDIQPDTPFVKSIIGTILVEKPLEEATDGRRRHCDLFL
jgi:hypothetical protein